MRDFKKFKTPAQIQDFLNTLKFNFEENGDTLSSPSHVLKRGSAHCFEGALLGAYLLSLTPKGNNPPSRIRATAGRSKPLIMCLKATKHDFDHVIAPFRVGGLWGALSKTNHAVLRYREPVYKNLRELAMSYFHEYFLHDGTKTLRTYSDPLDLNEFEEGWELLDGDLWGIDEALDQVKYHDIFPKGHVRNLRKADKIEREAGKLVEYSSRK